MAFFRFQQIKRYLYMSPLTLTRQPEACWHAKLDPLASHFVRSFKPKLY